MKTIKELLIWTIAQGRVVEPTNYQTVPPFQSWLSREHWSNEIPEGTVYGPMTYEDAQEFAGGLFGGTTICIAPNYGIQAVFICWGSLILERLNQELNNLLPGITFLSSDTKGLLLIGSGESFSDIYHEDFIVSCSPKNSFPIGRSWTIPVRNRRGENLRLGRDWTPPKVNTLENLAPLAEYIARSNLSPSECANYRAIFEFEAACDYIEILEQMDKELHPIVDTASDIDGDNTKRILLP